MGEANAGVAARGEIKISARCGALGGAARIGVGGGVDDGHVLTEAVSLRAPVYEGAPVPIAPATTYCLKSSGVPAASLFWNWVTGAVSGFTNSHPLTPNLE